MEENKEKVKDNKFMYGGLVAGGLWGLLLAHTNKQRSLDYLTGIAGGLAVGALAGYALQKASETLGAKKKEDPKETIKLSAGTKHNQITIERT